MLESLSQDTDLDQTQTALAVDMGGTHLRVAIVSNEVWMFVSLFVCMLVHLLYAGGLSQDTDLDQTQSALAVDMGGTHLKVAMASIEVCRPFSLLQESKWNKNFKGHSGPWYWKIEGPQLFFQGQICFF